jgi:hypothetical protein
MTMNAAQNWQWLVMAAVAVYGALLSTYNAYVARKQRKRQVKVWLSYGMLTNGPELSENMLLLSAANAGHRTVTLTSYGFRLPDGRQLVAPVPQGNASLPCELTEGKSCMFWMSVQEVSQQLKRNGFSGTVRIKGFYRDAVDGLHSSKPFSVNIDQK